jgi:hypothetical protein
MKKHINNLIKIIIAILALFIIFTKPTIALLNVDDDQSKVETQLGNDLGLGVDENSNSSENNNSNSSTNTAENKKSLQDIIDENEKNRLLKDAKKLITIDSILFNEEPLVDVNFFDDSEAVQEIKEKNPKAFIIQLRNGVRMWYYIIRNIAIMVMVVILMYVAIRMLLNIYTSSAENKARYKEMMIAWVKALSTLVVMHIIIYTVIAFNTDIINTIKDVAHIDDPRLQNLNIILLERALDIRLSISFPATILYVLVTYLTVQYFFLYLKRFILVLILIISGPFIILKTAYESTGKSVSKAYSKWLYDLMINVMEQSLHALFYALFVKNLFEGAMTNLIGFLIFWFVLKSMLKITTIVLKLFKFNSKAGAIGSEPLEHSLNGLATVMVGLQTAKAYTWMTTRPALALGKFVGGATLSAGIAGSKLIANKLSINKDLNDPNTELIRDKLDKAILGNKFVSKYVFGDETGEETEKLLEIRKDARRETESSKYSKELARSYINNKTGQFTSKIGITATMHAMKLARVVGVPFALIKDLTDGQNISFRTLELFSATDWKKAKKDYDKRKEKAEKKEVKYKNQVTNHSQTIRDKIKVKSEYRDLLADRRKKKGSVQTTNDEITADDIKAKLRRIHYLDINPNSLDKVIKIQMAELNIEKKEDLTNAKISLILDRVIEKSKLDYSERQAALEKLNAKKNNRFVDENQNQENSRNQENNNINNENQQLNLKNIDINNENNRTVNENEGNDTNSFIYRTNSRQSNNNDINDKEQHKQNSNYTNEEKSKKENRYISNIDNIENTNLGSNPNNSEIVNNEPEKSQSRNETKIDIHDISEARAKREGSRYIAEELSRVLTSVIADDENIERIGNSVNALKDSNDKNKKKINVNKFIDNL